MQHLLFLIPLLPLIGFTLWIWWMVRESQQDRSPLSARLLRPPGHSLALKTETLQDRFLGRFVLALLLAAVSVGLASPSQHSLWGLAVLLTVALWEVGVLITLRASLLELRNHARGLAGERAVGETLSALRAEGCHVFHDLVHDNGERSFNIDHIVVGAHGVFAIETKYRRKRLVKGRATHEVDAHAHTLDFPTGVDHKAIPQAEQNAKWLAGFLRKATAEAVRVQPIVTLPGWYVNLRERNGVPVLNEKQIAGHIRQFPRTLGPEQVQRIAFQLEQRCRDVAL
jgi:hypothetical protein